ncbi:MAG TPA: amidohydrolase family protein [Vicinamibacterales bacterium]|nr:amidohydrolase family protein [Vicinamibacterales bacterium]
MIHYRASWVLPIASPPIRDGVVHVEDGVIRGVDRSISGHDVDLGSVAILPALVNAHTHLELSWMRGLVKPGHSMPLWAERLMRLRAGEGKPQKNTETPPQKNTEEHRRDESAAAIAAARAAGTGLVGDVTNTFAAYEPLAQSGIGGAVFRELLGFNPAAAETVMADAEAEMARIPPNPRLNTTVVPHAPYSVSPALFALIAARAGGATMSIHLAESREEVEFLRTGRGEWRRILEMLGVWDDAWEVPGCGPVEYIARFGLVGPNLLAVHGVQFTDEELGVLARAGATVVACPRSNKWTGAGEPPVERFYASGVRVAVGTDSLASVEDLNVFAELAEMRRLAPSVPARRLLESATRTGANALGFGTGFGTLEAGKRAAIIAVRIPRDVADVEEYLVGGVDPLDITWPETDVEP